MEKSELYYVCKNKFCTYYSEKKPFQLDLNQDGEEIKKCPKCGEPDVAKSDIQPTPGAGIKKDKPNYRLFGLIIGVIVVLIAVAIILFTGKKETVQKPQEPSVETPQAPPSQTETTPVQSETGKVEETVKKEPSTVEKEVKEPAKPKEKESPPSAPAGKQTLTFADGSRYVGELKNGKMDGLGTYYFNSEQLISERDLKKRMAAKGDYLIGEWYEGRLVNGKLFDKDNNQKEVVIIGR